jgi:hypothetical protein
VLARSPLNALRTFSVLAIDDLRIACGNVT